MDFNARDFLTSKFIRKDDLRTGGPRRLLITDVEKAPGLPGLGGRPAKDELVLVFADGMKFGLRARVNLERIVEAFGMQTSNWIGKTVELYFSPDISNPSGGAPGGIRVRIVDAPSVIEFKSELGARS